MREAAARLLALGAPAVLLKGGHLPGDARGGPAGDAEGDRGVSRRRASRRATPTAPAAPWPRRSRPGWPRGWRCATRWRGPGPMSARRSLAAPGFGAGHGPLGHGVTADPSRLGISDAHLPLRHRRRLHRPPLRRQPARRVPRRARPARRRDAGARRRVQPQRDHLRAAVGGSGEHRPRAHLQPPAEMPFAGHPNVGTGWVLAQRAATPTACCGSRRWPAWSRFGSARRRGAVPATIAAPQPLSLGAGDAGRAGGRLRGLPPDDVVTTAHRPIRASVGNSFVIAEVTAEALTRATPDIGAFRRRGAAFPALGPRPVAALPLCPRPGQRHPRARCSRRWPAPSRTRRRAAPRRRSPRCCCRSATAARGAATTSPRGRDGPAQPAARHGPARARRHPRQRSAAAACRCCAARRCCDTQVTEFRPAASASAAKPGRRMPAPGA